MVREAKPKKRALRWFAWIGVAALGVIALLVAAEWPSTLPWVIRLKVSILGPGLVYGPLAFNNDRWETVLAGVSSGDPSWLYVAADLEPALDTHPGEEMEMAVAGILDKNPRGALAILLPHYDVRVICGEEVDGEPLSADRARTRLLLLKSLSPSTLDARRLKSCITTLSEVLHNSGQRREE